MNKLQNSARAFLIFALAVGVGAMSWLLWHAGGKVPVTIQARAPQARGSASATDSVQQPVALRRETLGQMPQSAVASSLARQYADAADLRQFAAEALRHPELGGITYANHAIHLCRLYDTAYAGSGLTDRNSIPYDGKEDSTLYAKRVEYLQAMERRCASFISDELSSGESIRLDELAKQAGDRLSVMSERYRTAEKSGNEQERLNVVAEVLKMRDPLLLADVGRRVMLNRVNGELGYTLDGTFYSVRKDGGAIYIAVDLLPCEFGLACDGRDVHVAATCISQSKCFANRQELLTAELSVEERQRVAAFLRRLTDIVNSGDASAFRRG